MHMPFTPKLSPGQRQAIAMDGRPERIVAGVYGVNQSTVHRIRAARIPQPNCYEVGNATDFIRRLKRHKIPISVVCTSPPYNRGLKPRKGADWGGSKLATQGYAGVSDNLPWPVYARQQREFLSAAIDLVGSHGVVLYNHKARHQNLKLDLYQDIVNDFGYRDLIIWDRGSDFNFDLSFMPPSYEQVWMFAGRYWKRSKEFSYLTSQWGAVWKIPPAHGNEHAAPFPMELARRMVLLGNGGDVCDPYAGSGTVGFAVRELNQELGTDIKYYLNDISETYPAQFRDAIRKEDALRENGPKQIPIPQSSYVEV